MLLVIINFIINNKIKYFIIDESLYYIDNNKYNKIELSNKVIHNYNDECMVMCNNSIINLVLQYGHLICIECFIESYFNKMMNTKCHICKKEFNINNCYFLHTIKNTILKI